MKQIAGRCGKMEKIELIFIIIEFVFLFAELILNIIEIKQSKNLEGRIEKWQK